MRIWRPYDDATAHFRAALVLSMLKVRAVGWLSMRSHSVHWGCQCVVVVMPARTSAICIFLDAVGSP